MPCTLTLHIEGQDLPLTLAMSRALKLGTHFLRLTIELAIYKNVDGVGDMAQFGF